MSDEQGETTVDDPSAPEALPAPAAGRGNRPVAILSILVVVLGVLAVVQWRRSASLSGEARDRDEITRTAGAFGRALLSYDADDLAQARERVVRLATEDFGESYTQTFRSGLGTIITKLKATAVATVKEVYVTEVDGDEAKAMVVMDSKVQSSAGTRELVGSYLEMELRREDGTWKVDGVTAVAAAQETITSPKPSKPPS